MNIREMTENDLGKSALVHEAVFTRQSSSIKWLECNINAFPRILCFVAEFKDEIVGYIIWSQKSGFRKEAVIELEQIAVLPDYQRKGIGSKLINNSIVNVKRELKKLNSILKHIVVTTRADNYAQNLFEKTLGVKAEATISNLYSADEVFMVARNVQST